jgi:hypothetical protein
MEVISRVGDALIVRAAVSPINSSLDPGDLIWHQWYMVQDSAIGAVFAEPSGVAAQGDHYAGQIHLLATESIHGFRVNVAVFNVWKEFIATLSLTELFVFREGDSVTLDPMWRDWWRQGSQQLYSVAWVDRTLQRDGTVVLPDMTAVLEAVRILDEGLELEDIRVLPEADGETRIGSAGSR